MQMWSTWLHHENPWIRAELNKWTPFFGLSHLCQVFDQFCISDNWGLTASCAYPYIDREHSRFILKTTKPSQKTNEMKISEPLREEAL